jgi:hypothetical protein
MDTDVGLGIAVKTLLDDINPADSAETKQKKLDEFPSKFVPFATDFTKDLNMACAFFRALVTGIEVLREQIPSADRQTWQHAAKYLEERL